MEELDSAHTGTWMGLSILLNSRKKGISVKDPVTLLPSGSGTLATIPWQSKMAHT
jgi:hypothetical protein